MRTTASRFDNTYCRELHLLYFHPGLRNNQFDLPKLTQEGKRLYGANPFASQYPGEFTNDSHIGYGAPIPTAGRQSPDTNHRVTGSVQALN
jgi:hypothetical protein